MSKQKTEMCVCGCGQSVNEHERRYFEGRCGTPANIVPQVIDQTDPDFDGDYGRCEDCGCDLTSPGDMCRDCARDY